MKEKLLTALVILGIGAVALSAVLFIVRSVSASPVDKIFPRDTIFYLSVSDLSFARENIKTTRLWSALNSSETKGKFLSLKKKFFAEAEKNLGFDLNELVDLMERRVSLGIIALPKKGKEPELLFAADIRKTKSKMKELFAKEIEPALAKKGMKITEVEYKGYPYRLVKKEDKVRFVYGFIDSALALANSEDAMRRAIMVKKGDLPSLKENNILKAMKSRLSYKRGVFAYIDLKSLIAKVKEKAEANNPKIQEEANRIFTIIGLKGVTAAAFCSTIEREGFYDRFFLSLDPKTKGILGVMMDQKPREPKGIKLIPQDVDSMGIALFDDPDKLWSKVKEVLKKNLSEEEYAKFEEKIATFEKGFRINLEKDVLAPLGNEIGWASLAPREIFVPKGKPPIAMLSKTPVLFYFEAKDKEKIDKLIDQLTALIALGLKTSPTTEEYLGYTIKCFKNPELNLSPAISTVDDFYLIASDAELIKRAIKSYKDKGGIEESADFKLVTKGFPSKVNQLSYSNIPAILKKMAEMVKKEEIKKEELKEILEILPLIADRLFGAAYYTKLEKGGVYGEGFSSTGFFLGIAYLPMIERQISLVKPPIPVPEKP